LARPGPVNLPLLRMRGFLRPLAREAAAAGVAVAPSATGPAAGNGNGPDPPANPSPRSTNPSAR
ncbi:hypothetical protein VM98_34495, partial [Streptomyces rubellomurinus subsp. indigoferus]